MKNRLTSRGKKTNDILQFISEAGKKGKRYTDIIRFAYELTHGEGSYDVTDTYTDGSKYELSGNPHRGYWSGAFKTPSRDNRRFGHLMKYIQKNDEGNWVLRDEKMTPGEQDEYGKYMEWPGKNKYKEANYPSTRGDYDQVTGKYRPRISKKYADWKKNNGEWGPDHDDAYQIIDDEE